MSSNVKKIIAVLSSIILLFVTIVLILLYESDDNILRNWIFKTDDKNVEAQITESEDNEAEVIITPEDEYIKYITPSDDFKKKATREKKDFFCFAGDIFFSDTVKKGYDTDGIDGILDESYINKINSADLAIANLECSITDNIDNPEDKTFTFAIPTNYKKVLKELNIDLFTIANNHILDYGVEALNNTIEELDKMDIAHIGAGKDIYDAKKAYIKEIDGKRYAIIGASSVLPRESWKARVDNPGVFNAYDIMSVVEDVKLLRSYFDKIIVYMHWGKELENTSNELQQKFAHYLVDAGADLIVGTHSHTVQEIEYYKGVPIVYSIGNFIYGGQRRDMMMLGAEFDYSESEKGKLKLYVYPGVSNFQKTRRYWTNEELGLKLSDLQLKSKTCFISELGEVESMKIYEERMKKEKKEE